MICSSLLKNKTRIGRYLLDQCIPLSHVQVSINGLMHPWFYDFPAIGGTFFLPSGTGHWNSSLPMNMMKVLPFDLATSPRVFSILLAPVAAHLPLQERLMLPYIDDISHAHASFRQACHTRDPDEVGSCPSSGDAPLGSSDRHTQELVSPSPVRLQTIVHVAQGLLSLTQVSP